MNNKTVLLAMLSLLATPLLAQEAQIEPPPPPPVLQSGEPLEPDVTIIKDEKKTVYEYRINGQLYMVKVEPKVGKPYYFLDSNGDGQLDVQETGKPSNAAINQWILFRW